jgi:6-phosphogluconolactonase (cycloisomerase 2 family)
MIPSSFLRSSRASSFSKLACAALLLALSTLSGCGEGNTVPAAIPILQLIEITPPNPSLAAGTSTLLTATAVYSDNSRANVTTQVLWSSSNTAIATARPTGEIQAGRPGSVTLSASLRGISTSTMLVVSAANLVSIAVTPAAQSIAAGTLQPFTATGTFTDNSTQNLTTQVTWASATTSVATISNSAGSNGLASSVAPGSSAITAARDGITSTPVSLSVSSATLVSISVMPATPSIALGTSQSFTATGTYSDQSTQNLTTQVTWASAMTTVATISNSAGFNGLASSVAAGSSAITAARDGITSAPIGLTVSPATLVSIDVTSIRPKIALGITRQLTATGSYTDSSTQDLTGSVTWASSAPSILLISNASGTQGQATGLATGSLSVSASLGTVSSASLPLAVTIAKYAYVVNFDANTVSQYVIAASGTLTAMTPATIGTGTHPESVTVDPAGRYAYVPNSSDNTVSQYAIGADGALSAMTPATIGTGSGPVSVAVDPTSQYVYVANDNDSTVSQYTIGASGALSAMTPATVGAGLDPYSVTVDSTGRYVYMTNVADNSISQYTIGAGGALTPIAPAAVGTAPFSLFVTVDPSANYLYVTSFGDSTVLQYAIGAGGALSAMTPATVSTGANPQSVVVDPTGRYAYVTNANGAAVSQYTIGAMGALSAMTPATVNAGMDPTAITVEPTGRYAYVVSSFNGTVLQYAIGAGGALSAMTPASISNGAAPYGIATTD